MWAHRPGDEPKAGAVWNLGAEQQFKELFFLSFFSICDGGGGEVRRIFSLLFRPERLAMEVSVRLRPPPASAASRRGRGSLPPPPPPPLSFPSARPASRAVSAKIKASAIYDLQRSKSNLESLFCYDKSVPEEDIGKPTGLDLEKKNVGKNPPCVSYEAKGAVLCATCAGSGLYVDSILESQGIIVKVRCLGCGGTGNIMCSKCGGRGHT